MSDASATATASVAAPAATSRSGAAAAVPTASPTLLQEIEADVQKAEAWVVTEFGKIKTALQNVEATVAGDVVGIFNWIKAHQAQVQSVLQSALTGFTIAGAADPAIAPLVPIATTSLDAAEAAIDSLSSAVVQGSTPYSTLSNAYAATKAAASAVSAVVSSGVTGVTAAAGATPVAAVASTTQAPASSS